MDLNKFLLFLKCIDGIGDTTIRKLIDNNCFDKLEITNNEDIFNWLCKIKQEKYLSSKFDIKKFDKNSDGDYRSIRAARLERKTTIENLEKIGGSYITYFDEKYPDEFRKMEDYPVILYYLGNIEALKANKKCAIIGTREPSEKAIEWGYKISRYMTKNNYVVVSGLAQGCDTLGHQGCLDEKGITIAILGTPLKKIYPAENKKLFNDIIANNGLAITEYKIGELTKGYSFVQRDRLQAALSDKVIAIQTSINGGTMHASKAANLKYNKELYVCSPKIIDDGDCSGNKELIENYNAIEIKDINDIIA